MGIQQVHHIIPVNVFETYGTQIQNLFALDCDVDVWHDRTFRGSFFFSDALHQVLAEQNMLEQWNMKSCKLIYSQFKPK